MSPKGSSPKLLMMGAFENWRCCSLGVTLHR